MRNDFFIRFAFMTRGIFLLLWLTIISCNLKQEVDDVTRSVKKMEDNAAQIKPEEWELFDQQIEKLKYHMKHHREDYTEEEVTKNNKLIGKYYALKASRKLGDLKQDLKDVGQQLDGMYESIFNEKGDTAK